MQRVIAFLAYPNFQLLDLSGPLTVFEVATSAISGHAYQVTVVSPEGGAVRSSSGIEITTESVGNRMFDTLVVPGGRPCLSEMAAGLSAIASALAPRCRRVASVCTGAFVLARAGLLDDRRATTHWRHAATLRRQFPRVKVDTEPFFVQDGRTWTATGTNAGIDLALSMVEEDFGAAVARVTAQMMVVHQRRPGGQSQFAGFIDIEPETPRIRKALDYARTHLHERLSIEDLAEVACLSPRQFSRLFAAEVGMPPAKAVERLRTEAARLRIETSRDRIEHIAGKVGFRDPERMRRSFMRIFGLPPQSMRRTPRSP